MASLSNDEFEYSLPEMVFHECIILSESQKVESCARCPLCNEFAAVFHCANCVRSGDFTHSSKTFLERFAEKKHKIYKIEEEKKDILAKYETAFAKKIEIENVKYKISRCKENIQTLKANINIYKAELSRGAKTIEKYLASKSNSKDIQLQLALKLRKYRENHKLREASLKLSESELNTKQCALKSVENHRIKELVTHIFPITEVPPRYYQDTTLSEGDKYAALQEAQKTTYVEGQWVIAGSPIDDMQYKIVESCIPSTGDYSAYPAWCVTLKKLVSGEKEGGATISRDSPSNTHKKQSDVANDKDLKMSAPENPKILKDSLEDSHKYEFEVAYGITGALSYAAQLVNILAFYLDVHLPKRTSINDFNLEDNADKFNHIVAKLNTNVIHLCMSQEVDVSQLSAHRTISNLLLLIRSKENGNRRCLSFEEQEERLESLEDSIFRDTPYCDKSEDEDSIEGFVHVNEADFPESSPIPKGDVILCNQFSFNSKFSCKLHFDATGGQPTHVASVRLLMSAVLQIAFEIVSITAFKASFFTDILVEIVLFCKEKFARLKSFKPMLNCLIIKSILPGLHCMHIL